MSRQYKPNPSDFAEYLQSVVKLDVLSKITHDLDAELADSQRAMRDIKVMFDSIPNNSTTRPVPINTVLKQEDLLKDLEVEVPKLLMPDMTESTRELDLDNIIAAMKGYAEDLKKSFILSQPQLPEVKVERNMDSLELEQYASSLDQLSKRLANIKLNNRNNENSRNIDLEVKLGQLCQDVNMFTQMVQAKTSLSECNKNWTQSQQDNNSLQYDNIINKLLLGINEVTYLLQIKN